MTIESLHRTARALAVAAAALALGPGSLPAQAAADDKPGKRQKPRQVHPTGEEDAKAPTALELQGEAAIERMTSRSTEGLTMVEHEDGMASVDLEGRFMSVAVAAARADGSRAVVCDHRRHPIEKATKAGPEGAAAAVPKPAPNAAPVLEEK